MYHSCVTNALHVSFMCHEGITCIIQVYHGRRFTYIKYRVKLVCFIYNSSGSINPWPPEKVDYITVHGMSLLGNNYFLCCLWLGDHKNSIVFGVDLVI